jgi:hypothetical protein
MLSWLSVVAVVAIAVLCWILYRRAGAFRIAALTDRRRKTSRMVSDGEFVDGSRHLNVVLALTETDLFYENADMEASVDLRWVREVEYDTRLATGHAVEGGKVLRVRCFSQVFEFVLRDDVVARWQQMLPARAWVESDGTTLAVPAVAAT